MSSINPHYTFHYSQPEEYRFSHDSVFLARAVFEREQGYDLSTQRVLDLCAGSGIVGMDFLFHRRAAHESLPGAVDFVDVQSAYAAHVQENQRRLGEVPTACNFLPLNYADLMCAEFSEAYDLIVCNPPYFLPSQGKLSPNKFKNRCRFFIDSDFSTLLKAIAHILRKTGRAYVLMRDLPSTSPLPWEVLGEIRGTQFVRFKK